MKLAGFQIPVHKCHSLRPPRDEPHFCSSCFDPCKSSQQQFSGSSSIYNFKFFHLLRIHRPQDPTSFVWQCNAIAICLTIRVPRRRDAVFSAVPRCYGLTTISSRGKYTSGYPLLRLSLQSFVHTAQFWTTAWQPDNPVIHSQLWQKALMVDRRLHIECSVLHGRGFQRTKCPCLVL